MIFENGLNTSRYATRRTLLKLAVERSFQKTFIYILVWSLLFVIGYILGGLTMFELLILLTVIDSGIFIFAIHSSIEAKCGWNNLKIILKLLKHKEWIQGIRGKQLVYRNNGWEYSDDEWFIRINQFSACILFAQGVDFSMLAKHSKIKIFDDFARKRMYADYKQFDQYTFYIKDASRVTVQTDQNEMLLKWIAAHGGRTVFES